VVETLIIYMILCRSCCSEKNVHVVCPTSQGSESKKRSKMEIDRSIKEAFQSIEDAGEAIDTLIFVYSGHHDDSGFELLGNDQDVWSDLDLCRQIEELHNVKRVIAFLDCCYPKKLAVDCGLRLTKKVVQFCSSDTEYQTFGTAFTTFLIQAFTRKAKDIRCLNVEETHADKECVSCKEFNSDIITFEKLAIYLERHMRKYWEGKMYQLNPSSSFHDSAWVIAFNMRFDANVLFKINGKESSIKKDITQINTIEELKKDFIMELFERKYVNVYV